MRFTTTFIAASLVLAASFAPALAQPDRYHGGYHRHKHWRNKYRKAIRRSWNDERRLYQRYWNNPSTSARLRYDPQLRAAWLRYHNNRWNGNYDWSNYNNPAFIDYLHRNQPDLLTQMRSIFNF